MRQITTARVDAQVCVALGDKALRRFAGALYVTPTRMVAPKDFSRPWHEQRRLLVPELQAALDMRRKRGAGIDLAKLLAQPVTLRLRHGGEKLQPDPARPRRHVKDLFQEHGVPPWQRACVPYLWSGERLVWVAGLGIDVAFQARAGAPGVVPYWLHLAV